jgi:hypothetical protein
VDDWVCRTGFGRDDCSLVNDSNRALVMPVDDYSILEAYRISASHFWPVRYQSQKTFLGYRSLSPAGGCGTQWNTSLRRSLGLCLLGCPTGFKHGRPRRHFGQHCELSEANLGTSQPGLDAEHLIFNQPDQRHSGATNLLVHKHPSASPPYSVTLKSS